MAALISLDQAKTQIRLPLTSTEYDDDLELKRVQASAIVMDYLEDYVDIEGSPAWDETTDASTDAEFAIVQAAVLEVMTNLWRFRGDDEKSIDGPLTPRVVNMLRGLRIPPLA